MRSERSAPLSGHGWVSEHSHSSTVNTEHQPRVTDITVISTCEFLDGAERLTVLKTRSLAARPVPVQNTTAVDERHFIHLDLLCLFERLFHVQVFLSHGHQSEGFSEFLSSFTCACKAPDCSYDLVLHYKNTELKQRPPHTHIQVI